MQQFHAKHVQKIQVHALGPPQKEVFSQNKILEGGSDTSALESTPDSIAHNSLQDSNMAT